MVAVIRRWSHSAGDVSSGLIVHLNSFAKQTTENKQYSLFINYIRLAPRRFQTFYGVDSYVLDETNKSNKTLILIIGPH